MVDPKDGTWTCNPIKRVKKKPFSLSYTCSDEDAIRIAIDKASVKNTPWQNRHLLTKKRTKKRGK